MNENALSPGCDVWIAAEPERSRWSRKIDWYLGFQMMKAAGHATPVLAPALKSILSREEMETIEVVSAGDAPLMVASRKLLPNSTTVMVPFKEMKSWAETCHRVWTGLNQPRMRIFLPDDVSSETFLRNWRGDGEKIELVVS